MEPITAERLVVHPAMAMTPDDQGERHKGTYDPNGTIIPFDDSLPDLDDAPDPVLSVIISHGAAAPLARHGLGDGRYVSQGFVTDVAAVVARHFGILLSDTEAAGLLIHSRQADELHDTGWVSPAVERIVLNTLAGILLRRTWPDRDVSAHLVQEMQDRARALGMRVSAAQQ